MKGKKDNQITKAILLLILPTDVKEGRSSTVVSASSSWTSKKALKKKTTHCKSNILYVWLFRHMIRAHTEDTPVTNSLT